MTAFFKKAFNDMKASAKAQHQVDKANFQAVKAESRAHFQENRGYNTFAKAKADSKRNWEQARMTTAQRNEQRKAKQKAQIEAAQGRIARANAPYQQTKN